MILPKDTHVTSPAEIRRLTGQNLEILTRLQQGSATARQLSAIALKYTSRISDVRAHLKAVGQDIVCQEQGGVSVYVIVDLPCATKGHDLNEWGLR
jgi:hypothetical protein